MRRLHGLIFLVLGLPAVAAAECGYISSAAKPPLDDGIYPAEIRKIDGVEQPRRAQNRIRLSAGKHRIAIQERIGTVPRGYTALRKLGNREVALVLKILDIDVQADTLYQIGARLHKDRLDPEQPHAYWEPVVWREQAQDCG